jgi:hypothetical protein
VSVMDFGVEGAPYLVMDYVTGVTLRKVLEAGRLAPPRAVNIARQLLAGVAHAHAQKIIHRDLKPDNLILSDTDGLPDHVRILDFGLAKLRDGPAMTSGLAIGTPSYMSPEQTGAPGEIDGRTDIYAMGVVLHEMLAGEKPFVADKIAEILVMHRDVAPAPLRKLVPAAGISPALEAVVLRALQKRAEDRFQTAGEFSAALEQVPEATMPVRVTSAVVPSSSGKDKVKVSQSPDRTIAEVDATTIDPPGREMHGELNAPAVIVSPEASKPSGEAARSAVGSSTAVPTPMRWLGLGALVVVALLLLLVGLRRHPVSPPRTLAERVTPAATSAPASPAASASARPALAAPVPADPVEAVAPREVVSGSAPAPAGASARERQAEAARLAAKGEWEQALVVLQKAHRADPQDAQVAYDLANLCLEHKRWAEGAQAARVAGQRDSRFRSDDRLVKNLIHALGNDKGYERTEDVLHGFGAPAVPLLKEAAAHDKSPQVRERAAELLRGHGPTRVSSTNRSTFSRPAPTARSSTSGRSIFSR